MSRRNIVIGIAAFAFIMTVIILTAMFSGSPAEIRDYSLDDIDYIVDSAVVAFNDNGSTENATSGKCGDDVYWEFDENTGMLTISGTGAMYDYYFSDLYPTYYDLKNDIKSVYMGHGITSIGGSAFSGFNMLETITTSDSLTSIGNSAFSGCSSLTSIDIPDSVTSIGGACFVNCSNLKSITLPNKISDINVSTFSGCENLVTVNMPNRLTHIMGNSFQNCTKLLNITIPESVVVIGRLAFYNCKSLKSIIIPSGLTSIREGAFSGCTSLEKINIPNSVISIENSAFSKCSSLTAIDIPNSVTSIGEFTFSECLNLENVSITENVISIGYYAFSNCSKLKSVLIVEDIISGNNNSSSLIGAYAFSGCKSLISIDIPKRISSIGYRAFAGCESLKSIGIPNGVTLIDYETFNKCSSLTSVTIPNSVTSINSSAFANCTSLTSISIPDSVVSLESSVFYGCTSLKNVTIPNSVVTIGEFAFASCTSIINIVIPDSVVSLENSVFYGCTSLKDIAIPDSVISIGSYTFHNCTNLTNIIIPNSVISIGDNAFSGCESLTVIVLSDNLSSIKYETFSGCSNLKKITIPNSVISIDDRAFSSCNSLTDIIIPESVISLGNYALAHCANLSTITIPNSVMSIGDYTFYYCDSLTSISLSDNLYSIGNGAFASCSNLKSIIIPNSVNVIGSSAFRNNDFIIYGNIGSYAQTYAEENNIPFKDINEFPGGNPYEDPTLTPKTITTKTSQNGELTSSVWLDEYGYINAGQATVGTISCALNSGSIYTLDDIKWTSSDSSIIKANNPTGRKCLYIAYIEGYATIKASLPNGEFIDFPIHCSGKEHSHIEVDVGRNTSFFNRESTLEFKVLNVSDLNYNKYYDSDEQRLFNSLLSTEPFSSIYTKKIDSVYVELPEGFSVRENEEVSGYGTYEINNRTTIKDGETLTFSLTIFNNTEETGYPVTDYKEYDAKITVSIDGKTYVKYEKLCVESTYYCPPYVPPETGSNDNPEAYDAVDDKSSPAYALAQCYKDIYSGKITSCARAGFQELKKYVSKEWFDKIVADTEMFCYLQALGDAQEGDYDLGKIFGFSGLKMKAYITAGRQSTLEFTNVDVHRNVSKSGKVTVLVGVTEYGSSIGNTSGNLCIVDAYVKIGNEAIHCGHGGVSLSNISTISSDLKKIYTDNTHSSGSFDDFEYWLKTGLSDYFGVVGFTNAKRIASLVDKLYKSVSKKNLTPFALISGDATKLVGEIHELQAFAAVKEKIISCLCPVDIEIIDSAGNIVGKVVNNQVVISTDKAKMSVDGDKKYCHLSLDDDYTINLNGTDDGTMEYIVEEVVGDVVRTISFHDLPLSESKSYSGNINGVVFQSDENYSLTDDSGKIISVDDDTFSFESDALFALIPEYVTVTDSSGTIVESGSVINDNEKVTIKANNPEGFILNTLTVNGEEIESGTNYTIQGNDLIVEVDFKEYETGDYSISGSIKTPGDNSVSVKVELYDKNRNKVSSADIVDGKYSFSSSIQNGDYILSVSAPKYVTREYNITISDGTLLTLNVEIRKYGDITGDGIIDAKDATQILRFEAGYDTAIKNSKDGYNEYLFLVGRVLGFDDLTAKDATQILRYEAGLPSIFDTMQ